jgi:hydrogenase maturation factor HypF (carbamoyltransferase family)
LQAKVITKQQGRMKLEDLYEQGTKKQDFQMKISFKINFHQETDLIRNKMVKQENTMVKIAWQSIAQLPHFTKTQIF